MSDISYNPETDGIYTKTEVVSIFEYLGLYTPPGTDAIDTPNGEYIVGTDNKCYTSDEWNRRDPSIEACGIGVIHDSGSFIISLDEGTKLAWDYSYETNGLIDNVSTTTDTFDGISNTDAIIAVNSSTTQCAAAKARNYTWPIPTKVGYLGCIAEWKEVINRKTNIEALMALAGGVSLVDGSWPQFWASTQYTSSNAYFVSVKYGSSTMTNSKMYTGNYSRPFTTL